MKKEDGEKESRRTENTGKYDSILTLPHHTSSIFPRMPLKKRAAQFSPFKAMTGYEEEVEETERFTDSMTLLHEDRVEQLDRVLQLIESRLEAGEKAEVSVKYFEKDRRKDGGEYVTAEGAVKKIDALNRQLVLEGDDPVRIGIDRISGIEMKRES